MSRVTALREHWCIDRGIEVTPVGSWTIKKKAKRRGAEPDECYIFGTAKQERPHLAIEVEWTHGGIDKLAIYEKLGVEEVWYWSKGVIEIYVLGGRRLVKAGRSRVLPQLDIDLLASMLDRDTLTQAVRDFRSALSSG